MSIGRYLCYPLIIISNETSIMGCRAPLSTISFDDSHIYNWEEQKQKIIQYKLSITPRGRANMLYVLRLSMEIFGFGIDA